MKDYNPRQITQMRWENAKTLEHLIFKAYEIEFDGTDVKLSESLEARQLVKHIKYCYDNQVPLIIYEYANDRVFIATSFGSATEVFLNYLNNNINDILRLKYDGQDTLSISVEEEVFLSEDNVKTLFGNQSIIGTGNIDLYRHELVIKKEARADTEPKYEVYLTYYSSSSLKVDSVQDLTTLIKPSDGKKLFGIVLRTNPGETTTFSTEHVGIVYQNTIGGLVWQILHADDTTSDIYIDSVSDTVSSI